MLDQYSPFAMTMFKFPQHRNDTETFSINFAGPSHFEIILESNIVSRVACASSRRTSTSSRSRVWRPQTWRLKSGPQKNLNKFQKWAFNTHYTSFTIVFWMSSNKRTTTQDGKTCDASWACNKNRSFQMRNFFIFWPFAVAVVWPQ